MFINKMYKILLDTNFLIDVFKFKIRLLDELKRVADFPFKLYVVKGTIKELESLINKGKGIEKRTAKLSLQFIHDNLNVLDVGGNVDNNILKLAKKGFIPLTSDRDLKKRLGHCRFIILKQRKYLRFENVL